MNLTLMELFEGHKGGLLWVTKDSQVRHQNREAKRSVGLAAAGQIIDLELAQTIASVVETRQAQTVMVSEVDLSREGGVPMRCRVVPGLAKDDALVLIEPERTIEHDSLFDEFMHIFQHDIAQPLKAARAALNNLFAGPEEEVHVRPLLAPIDEVLSTVGKLLELAQVRGSGALRSTDRIEPRKLIDEVWSDLQGLARERGVSVQMSSNVTAGEMAPVYGSHAWIRRVFTECLGSALRQARMGSVLKIEHLQMGPRVILRFRDTGAFASRAREPETFSAAFPDRLARTRPTLLARDLIGFRLCQHIVEVHGGQLREETEDDARNILIDLPTGAPHDADSATMDAAQMQRYAHDLAQLMARVRRKPATADSI